MVSVPGSIIIEGVAGSTAHGLSMPDSDIDIHGIFVAPIQEVLGIQGATKTNKTVVTTNPDTSYHEVGKFFSLALKCNPTVLETLWLPQHSVLSLEGAFVVARRQMFLSESYVRGAFLGYARAQLIRISRTLDNEPDNLLKIKKHARHCFRLVFSGELLLKTSELQVDVSEHKDELFEWSERAVTNFDDFTRYLEKKLDKLDNMQSCLPQKPDTQLANTTLVEIRRYAAKEYESVREDRLYHEKKYATVT